MGGIAVEPCGRRFAQLLTSGVRVMRMPGLVPARAEMGYVRALNAATVSICCCEASGVRLESPDGVSAA